MSRVIATREYGKESVRTVLGKRSVVQPHVMVEDVNQCGDIMWTFSSNGWQGTGVMITLEEFKVMKELIQDPNVIEAYEKLSKENPS